MRTPANLATISEEPLTKRLRNSATEDRVKFLRDHDLLPE